MIATELWVWDEEGLPDETKWRLIRAYRNDLLARSDWTQVGDAPLTADEKNQWTVYRQALRNLPQDYSFPDLLIFPEQP